MLSVQEVLKMGEGFELSEKSSFSLHPPSAHPLQTGQALPDFLCTEARAFIFEFCSK